MLTKYISRYILLIEVAMQTAKLFQNGRSQAVRLPKEFQFDGDDVFIQRLGDAVILIPRSKIWDVFVDGINEFSDDFMIEGRDQGIDQVREGL
jgi:antitoxin VapB